MKLGGLLVAGLAIGAFFGVRWLGTAFKSRDGQARLERQDAELRQQISGLHAKAQENLMRELCGGLGHGRRVAGT